MPRRIELIQPINAPTQLVWKTAVEPRGMANWQADEAEGEARPGGLIKLHWSAFDSTIELRIVEFEPERRIRFKQGNADVEFRFEDGAVRLIQHDLDDSDDYDGLHASWTVALAQLAHCVERHPDRQRRVEWLVRSAATTPELVYLALTEPKLNRWLCARGGLAETGERYEMLLTGGQKISGRVLANVPGRDIAISCEEAGESVLVFRTLPSPGKPGERLVAAVWSEWGPPRELADDVIESIDASLEQLVGLLARVGTA